MFAAWDSTGVRSTVGATLVPDGLLAHDLRSNGSLPCVLALGEAVKDKARALGLNVVLQVNELHPRARALTRLYESLGATKTKTTYTIRTTP